MLGQRTSLTATVPAQSLNNSLFKYEYDPSYQLKKATYPNVAPLNGEVDSWTYDGIGNRLTSTVNSTTQTYAYQKIGSNPLNWQRLLSDGVNSYTYDTNGSTITTNGTPGNFTFGWDYENRMKAISGSATASYAFDYQGRRGSKTVSGSTSTYLYDGLNLIKEAGASSADYLFGPGIDEPLGMSRGGQVYYYGADGLGSASLVTDSSGTVQDSYLYDAWGQTRTQTGTLANPFGYTAREFGEGGTLFYRARYYSPGVGRFLSEDPSEPDLFPNTYLYVDNNPVVFIDPLGLKKVSPTPTPIPPSPSPTPTPPPFPRPRYDIFPLINICFPKRVLFWAETSINPYVQQASWRRFTDNFGKQCAAAAKPGHPTTAWCAPAPNLSGAGGLCNCCDDCPTPTPTPRR